MREQKASRRAAAFLAAMLLCSAGGMGMIFANAQTSNPSSASAASAQKIAPPDGERVFMNNCSRCHKPPMTIPPQITGTIVMHMRTRARLSRKDEQALLRYLAP
jgi:cytochrome c5